MRQLVKTPIRRLALALAVALAQPGARAAPAPTVSAPEAALLEQARELARSDTAAAAEQLAAAVNPESSAVFLDTLGVYYQRSGQTDKALNAFQDAVRRDPEFVNALENIARIHLEQGDREQALAALDAVLAQAPERTWPRISRARLLLEENRPNAAAHDLVILLDSPLAPGPDTGVAHKGEVWQLLGYARLLQDRPQAAVTALEQALAYGPEQESVRLQLLQAVLAADGPVAARQLARRELDRNPAAVEYWRILAAADYEQGRTGNALVRLECARLLGVATPKDLTDLGDLLLEQGLTHAALSRFREAGTEAGTPVGRLLDAADNLLGLGATDEAMELVTLLADREPPLTPEQAQRTQQTRARVRELHGDLQTAMEIYEALLAHDPLNAKLLMRTGEILARQGELAEAEARFERAGRVDPKQEPTALQQRARIEVERGDYQAAIRLLEAALQLEYREYVARYLDQVRRAAAENAELH